MKGYEKIKELINKELEDYSYFKIGGLSLIEENDYEEFYEIDIKMHEKEKTLYFRYDREEKKIGVQLSEDNYEETNDYSYKVKYFWMALLEW